MHLFLLSNYTENLPFKQCLFLHESRLFIIVFLDECFNFVFCSEQPNALKFLSIYTLLLLLCRSNNLRQQLSSGLEAVFVVYFYCPQQSPCFPLVYLFIYFQIEVTCLTQRRKKEPKLFLEKGSSASRTEVA